MRSSTRMARPFARREAGRNIAPGRRRISRRQPCHLDRIRIGHLQERLCWGDPDARFGNVLRPSFRQSRTISGLGEERRGQYAGPAGYVQARRATLLPVLDPGAESAGWFLRRGCFRKKRSDLQRVGCANCHVPSLFTEPGYNLHKPGERRVPG